MLIMTTSGENGIGQICFFKKNQTSSSPPKSPMCTSTLSSPPLYTPPRPCTLYYRQIPETECIPGIILSFLKFLVSAQQNRWHTQPVNPCTPACRHTALGKSTTELHMEHVRLSADFSGLQIKPGRIMLGWDAGMRPKTISIIINYCWR